MRLIKPMIKHNSLSNPRNSTLFLAKNIVIVVVIMFLVFGVLHFLLRFLMRFLMNKIRLSPNSTHQSTRFQETRVADGDTDVTVYQRQLQQLFNLQDSGLDQSSIDALPVFVYKELMGFKEFKEFEEFEEFKEQDEHNHHHCAVCLCEFTENDELRLLPVCSHAFHSHCIDTWLLSNSTCPLCRGSIFTHGFSVINPVFDFGFDFGFDHDHEVNDQEHGHGHDHSRNEEEDDDDDGGQSERVYTVKLGKFIAINGEKELKELKELKEEDKQDLGQTSNGNLDERRCYSMGSYEYVVGNSDLQVAFCKDKGRNWNNSIVEGGNGKEISNGSKGETFSVSKIWLWSKKDGHRFQDSSTQKWAYPVNLPY